MIIEEHLNTDTGALVVEKILSMTDRPDGIFAGNDMSAASLMFELKSRGVVIPDEIAISGFNNTYISTIVEPSLTTVNYPSKELGRIAASSLMEILEKESQVATRNILLKHELIVRNSSQRSL